MIQFEPDVICTLSIVWTLLRTRNRWDVMFLFLQTKVRRLSIEDKNNRIPKMSSLARLKFLEQFVKVARWKEAMCCVEKGMGSQPCLGKNLMKW